MINFFKKILSKEPEKIERENLKQWLENEIEARQSHIEKQKAETRKAIEESIKETEKLLDELADKELQNKNISVKEQQYMEGNRATFIKNTKNFLKKIPDFEDVENDYARLNEEMTELNKVNHRPYQILQHFFANETKDVTNNIKQIEEKAKELLEYYKKSGLSVLEGIKENFEKEEKKAKANQEFEKKLKEKKKEEEELNKQIEKTEQMMSELEKSDEFKDYKEKEKEKKKVQEDIKKQEEKLRQKIGKLEQPLKKNQRITLEEELNEKLLNDPVNAVISYGNKIPAFMQSLEKNIGGQIELKEKKKEKALQAIAELTKDFVDEFKSEYDHLREKKKKMENMLRQNHVMLEHNDLSYKIEHLKKKLEKVKEEEENINSKITKAKELDYEDIAEKLNSISEKRIVIE